MNRARPSALLLGLAAGAIVVATGCASAGPLPYSGDPATSLDNAQRRVAEAQEAGADSLATEAMTSARTHLQAAQDALNVRNNNRAALNARMAEADARYARAAAELRKAERDRDRAAAALAALPSGGSQ